MDRTRRLRQTAVMRSMVRENHVRTEELIYPLFVMEGENIVQPVESMPGICQYSVDRMNEELDRVKALQIPAILIFGIPEHKDEVGSGAYDEHGIVQTAIRRIKKDYPDLLVIADVCLCEYTSHGHCGLIRDGIILNDETLPLLAQTAVSYARAGADIIAPSDMMDKRVGAIRQALDAAGFTYTPIMAYSAKFASGYYGPFRDAAHSAPGFGDRKTYQMDPANGREAMREVEEDIAEGADLIIAKPAMAYMDIITEIRRNYNIPIVAYNVSGEYSMVKAAAANGWIDEKKIVMENLIGMKRAGADMIITHHPMIFEGQKKINNHSFTGRRILKLIRNRIQYYAMHTNYDVLGMAELSADYLKLTDREVLSVTAHTEQGEEGFGRVGCLPYKMTLKECGEFVKEALALNDVRIYGDPDTMVEKAAICTGSGKSMISDVLAKGADVYVTGDIDHHTGIDAVASGLPIIDAGHYGTEYIFMKAMRKILEEKYPSLQITCAKVKSPYMIL